MLSSYKAPFFSIEDKISFLQYIAQTESIAFLEQNPSSDTKKLHIMSLNDGRSSFVYEFTSPIEQLYIQENSQAGIVVTAVNKENITSVYIDNFQKSPGAIIIPNNEVRKLSDFINIIHGQLTPHISSSTTLATITTRTKRTTSATKPTTEISTKKETTVSTTTKAGKITETTVIPFETTTIHQTTEPSTNKPTTEKETSKITKTTVHRITTFTKPSIHTLTTTQIPFTEKTTPTTAQPAIANVGGSNNAGIVVGSIVGLFGVIGLMAFGIYKCIQHHRDKNGPPPFLRLEEEVEPGIELENIENCSETPPLN